MGLESFKTKPKLTGEKNKFQRSILCPSCGSKGEKVEEGSIDTKYRCTTDSQDCSTITWIHTNYELDNATVSELR